MILNKIKYRLLFLIVSLLIVFVGCQKDSELDDLADEDNGEVVFEFPAIRYVDSLIYQEIVETCEEKWDLSQMEESTFVVISYLDEYVVHCVGVDGNRYYWFLISFDLNGQMINESRRDYNGRGTYFDIKNLEELKLDSIRNFWNGGLTVDIDSARINEFRNSSGFVADYSRIDESGNTVILSVFNTKDDAVKAMETRTNPASCSINVGDTQALPGFWWYYECGLYNAVIVNRWNTIFEVGRNNVEFKAVEDTLYTTGNEIERRLRLLLN